MVRVSLRASPGDTRQAMLREQVGASYWGPRHVPTACTTPGRHGLTFIIIRLRHGYENQTTSRDNDCLEFLLGTRATDELCMTPKLGSRKQRPVFKRRKHAAMLSNRFPKRLIRLKDAY